MPSHPHPRRPLPCTAPRSPRRTRRGSRSPSSRWAASGARRRRSGQHPGRLDHGRRLPGRLHAQRDLPEACSGKTGHAEIVRVVFDPSKIELRAAAEGFWENHDPTQGMRQGNDVGTQYRSAIFVHDDAQRAAAEASRTMYQEQLTAAGLRSDHDRDRGRRRPPFYFAEDYHQQYLDKNPERLLPEPRHRREAAGRLRRHAAPVRRLALRFSSHPTTTPDRPSIRGLLRGPRQPAAAGGSVGGVAGAGAGAAGAAAGAAATAGAAAGAEPAWTIAAFAARICSNAARCAGVISSSSCSMKFCCTPG